MCCSKQVTNKNKHTVDNERKKLKSFSCSSLFLLVEKEKKIVPLSEEVMVVVVVMFF